MCQSLRALKNDALTHMIFFLSHHKQMILGLELSYDKLVIAVGAQPNTFGIPGVQAHGLFLKERRKVVPNYSQVVIES